MAVAQGSFIFGGRLCLDLTWTVRFRAVAPSELLVDDGDVGRWLFLAGAVPSHRCHCRALEEARLVREAIWRGASAQIGGRSVPDEVRRLLNRAAGAAVPVPQLSPTGGVVLRVDARPCAAGLSAVARDAIQLFASTEAGRLRACADERCALLFFDDSRPGRRRWCDVARCGNRANTKAYRGRRQATSLG